MKKLIIYITLLLPLLSTTIDENCTPLSNGEYKVVLDAQFKGYKFDNFTIRDSVYTVMLNGVPLEFKYNKISECRFNLKSFTPDSVNQDSLNDVEKALKSLGEPYYVLTSNNGDTTRFQYRHNPHILIYSGKFIKLNK